MSALTGCGTSDDGSKSTTPPAGAAGAAPGATAPDQGHGSGHDPGASGAPGQQEGAGPAKNAGAEAPATGEEAYFVANLTGADEVPGTDGKAVNDQDGKATAYVRIKGGQVAFSLKWEGIGTPTAAHIHQGVKGANGAVVVPFFAAPLPDGSTAATGSVAVADADLLNRIKNAPERWYFNLHTAEFPGGAVRGQLTRLDKPVDMNGVLKTGKPEGTLTANASGAQEVAPKDGKAFNDPDGKAVTAIRPWGNCVDYAFSWTGTAPPTLGHVHQAAKGSNGDVVAPLFAAQQGLPQSLTGLAGTVEGVKPEVVKAIAQNPAGFYTNLHTAEFPGGGGRRPRRGPPPPPPPGPGPRAPPTGAR
ncbi:CHRD domain-containing protein, partial [Yinghuangia soli]